MPDPSTNTKVVRLRLQNPPRSAAVKSGGFQEAAQGGHPREQQRQQAALEASPPLCVLKGSKRPPNPWSTEPVA